MNQTEKEHMTSQRGLGPLRESLLILAAMLIVSLVAPQAHAAPEDVIYYTPTDEGGFILDWLVSRLHIFDYAYLGGTTLYDALKSEGGEKNIEPRAGMKAAKGLPWQECHYKIAGSARGAFEFPPASMTLTYAFIYVYADEEMKDLLLCTGSDDALLVLLNGEKVQQIQMQRGYAVDQDTASGITLRKGWNRLLCKIDDYGGGHGLCVRFKTADSKPVTDLKICLSRPADNVEINFIPGVTYEAEAAHLLREAMKINAEQGDAAGAEKMCRQVVAKYPKSNAAPEALYQAARFLIQLNKPDDALKTFDELSTRYPYAKWVEDALIGRANIYKAKGDLDAARKVFELLIVNHEGSNLIPDAMIDLARIQAQKGDPDGSDSTLNEVRRKLPDTVQSVQALELLGDNRKARNQPNEAKALWKQAIDEAKALSEGKYIWYVNVQAVLQSISDSSRAKIEGKK